MCGSNLFLLIHSSLLCPVKKFERGGFQNQPPPFEILVEICLENEIFGVPFLWELWFFNFLNKSTLKFQKKLRHSGTTLEGKVCH